MYSSWTFSVDIIVLSTVKPDILRISLPHQIMIIMGHKYLNGDQLISTFSVLIVFQEAKMPKLSADKIRGFRLLTVFYNWGMVCFTKFVFFTLSRPHMSTLCRWCTLNKAVTHTQLWQGRSQLGFDSFLQQRLLALCPNKRNCCVFCCFAGQKNARKPGNLRIPCSSHQDIVFWQEP